MNWRVILAWCAGAAYFALSTGCGSAPSSQAEFVDPSAGAEWKFPSNGLGDWVTYAEQVSVVTVISESRIEPPPEVESRGEGYVGRMVSLRVDLTLWAAPGHQAWDGVVDMIDAGWIMHDGKVRPLHNSRLEVGRSYVLPFADAQGKLGSISPAAIEVADGRIADEIRTGDEWQRQLGGVTLQELQSRLETTPIDPVAAQFSHLGAVEKAAAVRVARTGSPSWPRDQLPGAIQQLEAELAKAQSVAERRDLANALAVLRAEFEGLAAFDAP